MKHLDASLLPRASLATLPVIAGRIHRISLTFPRRSRTTLLLTSVTRATDNFLLMLLEPAPLHTLSGKTEYEMHAYHRGIIGRKAISPNYRREKLGLNSADLAPLNEREKDGQHQTDPVGEFTASFKSGFPN